MESKSQEEYYEISLNNLRNKWIDHILTSGENITSKFASIMSDRREKILKQACESIDAYIADYKKAMDPSRIQHADAATVTSLVQKLRPFCERISAIIQGNISLIQVFIMIYLKI